MKNFLKMTLAVVCGMLIVTILCWVLLLGFVGAATASSQPTLPKSGVLKIDMSKISLAEQSAEANPFSSILAGTGATLPAVTIGIWDAICAVNAAAEDPAVKYIYLKTDGGVSSIALLQEFRAALSNFRTISGKPIVAYTESVSTASYYLASVADKIYMSANPGATHMLTGVSSQAIFFGDLLKRLGVNVQLIRHGKYKAAGEAYTRGSSSPENRNQMQTMVNSIWSSMATEIAQSRDLSVDALNSAIDNLLLCENTDFLEYGLVDALLTRSELENKLADLAVLGSFKDLSFISFSDYVSVKTAVSTGKLSNKIAVIYANGQIVDGAMKTEVAGDRFASIIAKVRADSSIKAVVLRVNSPGGSVLASDKIKTELDLLKGTKPLIASYGDYAASGGYWISSNCDKIYSDATSLTGSIGVFGLFPDFSKTVKDKAHVGVETYSSNKHGDILSLMRPFDSAETAYFQRSIESIYDNFISLVSEGRGLEKSFVDEVAQGRVWVGADAHTLKLVDEIGGLEQAIQYAALAAGDPDLANWRIKEYPKAQSQMESLLAALQSTDAEDYSVILKSYSRLKECKMMARLPYDLSIR